MRLVCPNCNAQYEVDDNAIPEAGRDVQCSSCGHGWFQYPPDLDAEMEAETALFGALKEQLDDPATVPDPTTAPNAPSEPDAAKDQEATEEAEADVPEAVATLPRRGLDDSLMAVLREEAEREETLRRTEAARPLETQTDLGLEEAVGTSAMAKTMRDRIARLRGGETEQEPDENEKPSARRDLLPDIEEINSTLRASSEGRDEGDDDPGYPMLPPAKPKSGFRSGFSLVLLLAVLMLVAYVAAPQISQNLPATEQPLKTYVTGVDAARVWLDDAMQKATSILMNLTGSDES